MRPPGQGARAAPARQSGQRNLTEGPITRTLLLFSLPMLGGNALQSLNGTVNQIWVSHTLGETAITALGNSDIVMMLLIALFYGFGMAANILVAQAVGAGDIGQLKRVMGATLTFFAFLSVPLAVAGFILSPALLRLIGAPVEAMPQAVIYLEIVFATAPFMLLFIFLQMAQGGAGDSITPFWFLALAVVIDVILNPVLIRGLGPFPRLGIAGSACSTLVGQGVALVLLIVHLYRKNSPILPRQGELHLLRADWVIFRSLVTRGLPMGVQMLILSAVAAVMISLVNRFGFLTSAAYTSSSIIWRYLQMPAMAIGASVSSMAAQNVGAGRWDRVDQVARAGLLACLIVTGVIATLLYMFMDVVLAILLPHASPATPLARHINTVVLWGFLLFSMTSALSGVVRSTGAVWAPLMILIISLIVVRVPIASLLVPRLGADAIWWSFPLGSAASTLLTSLYYRYGGWRRARMLDEHSRGPPPVPAPRATVPDEEGEAAALAPASGGT